MSQLLNDTLAKLNSYNLTNKKLTIAYSGGVDSSVLLNIFAQLASQMPSLNISAIHINHGLSKHADLWQKHCQLTCEQLNIPLQTTNVIINKLGGESLENNARRERYKIFEQINADIIILAHHQNDQIETIFSQFLRGSDLHNLAGMQELSSYKNKQLWRPLLSTPKNIILDYAKHYKLNYINDESNLDNQYLRNFIRNQLLPLIKARDIQIDKKILNIGHNIKQNLNLTDEISYQDLQTSLIEKVYLSIAQLKQLSLVRCHQVINLFLKSHHIPHPSQKHLQEFIRQVFYGTKGKNPRLELDKNSYLIKQKQYIVLIHPISTGSTSK